MLEDCSVALLGPTKFSLLPANQTQQPGDDDNVDRCRDEEMFPALLNVILLQGLAGITTLYPAVEWLSQETLPGEDHKPGSDKSQTSEEHYEAKSASLVHLSRRSKSQNIWAPLSLSSTGNRLALLSYSIRDGRVGRPTLHSKPRGQLGVLRLSP